MSCLKFSFFWFSFNFLFLLPAFVCVVNFFSLEVRASSTILRMQLKEIDTDGNGKVDAQEWLEYIKLQADSNAQATKKLLRSYAVKCGAEMNFDEMKKAAAEEAEQRALAAAELALKEENRKADAERKAAAAGEAPAQAPAPA